MQILTDQLLYKHLTHHLLVSRSYLSQLDGRYCGVSQPSPRRHDQWQCWFMRPIWDERCLLLLGCAACSGVAQCALQSCRYNTGCCMVSCSMQPGPVLTGGHMTNEPGGRWSAEANQEAGGGGWGGANVKITQVPLPPSISQQLDWSWSVHTVDSTKNVKIGVEWRHVIYLCCLLSSCVCLDWYLASHLIRSNPCPQIHFRWSAKC